MQHARPVGPTTINAPATFSPEMAQGCVPSRSPTHAAWRPPPIGWSVSQPTHVSAPFEPAMITADRPTQSRAPRPFSVASERDWQVTPPDVSAFSVEMVAGSRPDRPRLFLPLRTGCQVDTAEQLAAVFSIEMLQADRPSTSRLPKPWYPPSERDYQVMPPEVLTFSVEQAQGSHPDSPRLFTVLPHLGLAVSQLSPVAAPFSMDMVMGAQPDRNRERLPLRIGQQLWISDIIVLSPDMTQGSHPDAPRLPRLQIVPMVTPPTVVAFSVDMAIGHHPDRPVLMHGRDGWIAAPPNTSDFSIDMVRGSWPDSPRLMFPLRKLGLTDPASAPQISAPFSMEMVAGWVPHRSRVQPTYGLRGSATWPLETFAAFTPATVSTASVTSVETRVTRTVDAWIVRTFGDV